MYSFYDQTLKSDKETNEYRKCPKRRIKGRRVKCHDLRLIADELMGKKIVIDLPGHDKVERKTVYINRVYEHQCIGYHYGKGNVFLHGISIGDLVEKGIVSFDTGYPEVVG